jgi:hypothetical protein
MVEITPRGSDWCVDRKGAESGQGPRRPVSWLLRQIVVLIPVLVFDPLLGKGVKLFSGPRAIVVLVLLEAFIFIHAEQDKSFLGPGIYDARRGGVGMFQGLRLLFGEFDHWLAPFLHRIVSAGGGPFECRRHREASIAAQVKCSVGFSRTDRLSTGPVLGFCDVEL